MYLSNCQKSVFYWIYRCWEVVDGFFFSPFVVCPITGILTFLHNSLNLPPRSKKFLWNWEEMLLLLYLMMLILIKQCKEL